LVPFALSGPGVLRPHAFVLVFFFSFFSFSFFVSPFRYITKFGFPFIVFVNGRSKQEIVPVFEARMGNAREAELATAVADFVAIARSRLAKLI